MRRGPRRSRSPSGLRPSDYYLTAIQVGMEFNDINGAFVGGYRLYNWTISVLG